MRATTQGAKVLTAVEGIYKDGEVELLERPEGLREARVIVTFLPLTPAEPSREEARNRMRAGIPLGGPPYPGREEIYERGSPFDVAPVSTQATTQDILDAIRESRERE